MAEDPIRTTTFLLRRGDALAYQQAVFRLGRRGAVGMVAGLVACGGLALLIPPEWAGPRLSLSSSLLVSIAMVIGLVVMMTGVALAQWLRARRQLGRRPVEMTLNEWPDRIETLAGGTKREIALDVLTPVVGPEHLSLTGAGEPVILPRAYFPDAAGFDGLLERIAAAKARGAAAAAAEAAAPVDQATPNA